MHAEIERAIARAKERRDGIEASLVTLCDLPDLRGIRDAYAAECDAYITAVYDMPTYRHNRQILAEMGWQPAHVFITTEGWRYTELKTNDGETLTYIMKPELNGSTCTREKVGEEVTDVYKVTCR